MSLLKLRKSKNGVIVARVDCLLKKGLFRAEELAQIFVHINNVVWGEITNSQYIWKREMVLSHFRVCSRYIYCLFYEGNIVGTLTNMLTEEESLTQCSRTWMEITGGGYLTTHKPKGKVGFGVDLSVLPGVPRGASDKLVMTAVLDGVIGAGLRAVYLGARIPSYWKYRDMNVREYVFGKRKSGKPLDPELYFYLKQGFEIVRIIPDYMEDPKSLNYGVLIRWKNPFYWMTRILPFLKPVISVILEKIFLRLPEKN